MFIWYIWIKTWCFIKIIHFESLLIKQFKIISSFFLKLFGAKIFVYSVNIFPASKRSINPVQKYSHIIESYAFAVKNICFNVFIVNKYFYLFRSMFYTKRIEISNIFILHIQSNPMSPNIRVLIKICYISPILNFR